MRTNLPHLAVTDFDQNSFTTVKNGRLTSAGHPPRNREEHTAWLREKLTQAWTVTPDDQAVYQTHRNGVYLEFRGEPGYELITKSLESLRGRDPSQWTRLLNVRREINSDNQEVVFATLYVPNNKKALIFNQIEKYATESNARSGLPKNAALLESINDIRRALEVESFWQDARSLIPTDEAHWCEVWLSSDQPEVLQRFENLLARQNINSKPGSIRFPERTVKLVHANRAQLEIITRLSDNIAEYRRAKETAAFWLDQNNKEQAEWVATLLERLEVDAAAHVSICILDTGVNNGHPLIGPLLSSQDCQSFDPDWGAYDHDKHGTLMAGVCAYGDLQELLTHDELIRLRHCLESVKILPPSGINGPELWGHITEQCIYKAEIQKPAIQRIACMAVTSDDTRDRGRPSSWSAKLDQLCSGAEDDSRRFLVVSAGNSTISDRGNYPDAQLTDSVHDPAQSWNALTVGAYTRLDRITDPTLSGYEPVAPVNGLSPFTTTTLDWDDRWPIKPEIVMEGGNLAKDSSGFITECDDLSVLSTFYNAQRAHFYPFCMTSAATARAAWFAAQIQADYPEYWPETVRGLMVHSAEWTDTLRQQFLENRSKTAYKRLLRICGYGVPNLEKARFSASNSLTLVAQSEIQPFDKKADGSGYCTKDMHLYELPWPKETLQLLPDAATVQMRVTLSYFVEPGPGEIGWKDRYRYPSHGLRFDINSPTEEKSGFVRRINAAARDEENGHPGTSSASDHWILGQQARDKGSIHSDIWVGSAAQLASSNMIAVYPTIGWWRERAHKGRWGQRTRYALIVSIDTPAQDVDIYTPVAIKLGVVIPIEVST